MRPKTPKPPEEAEMQILLGLIALLVLSLFLLYGEKFDQILQPDPYYQGGR